MKTFAALFGDGSCRPDRLCSVDPLITSAGIGAGAGLVGSALNFFGANKSAKEYRKAMERYIAYMQNERNKFLTSPETGAIKTRLNQFVGGNVGYSPEVVNQMKEGVYEDYGKGLADISRVASSAPVMGGTGGNVYRPGQKDRATRLLGQNLAANRATMIRDINKQNADVALNSERFAIQALPTFMEGFPATPMIGPDAFAGTGATAHPGQFFGPFLTQAGMPFVQNYAFGPIAEMLAKYRYGDPVAAANYGNAQWYDNPLRPGLWQRDAPLLSE